MQAQDIRNVLELQVLFANHGLDTAGQNSEVLAALLDWKNANGHLVITPPAPKAAAPEPAPAPAPTPARTRTKRQTTAPTSAPADDTDF